MHDLSLPLPLLHPPSPRPGVELGLQGYPSHASFAFSANQPLTTTGYRGGRGLGVSVDMMPGGIWEREEPNSMRVGAQVPAHPHGTTWEWLLQRPAGQATVHRAVSQSAEIPMESIVGSGLKQGHLPGQF